MEHADAQHTYRSRHQNCFQRTERQNDKYEYDREEQQHTHNTHREEEGDGLLLLRQPGLIVPDLHVGNELDKLAVAVHQV